MNTQYLTLKRNDERFLECLWGKLANSHLRPVPIKTHNLGADDESVTFQLLDRQSILGPNFLVRIGQLIKIRQFLLIVLPLFLVISESLLVGVDGDFLSLAQAAVAMSFIFAGSNIRNDVLDHLSGFDRVNVEGGRKKPIQKGWVTARFCSRLSWFFIGIGVLISLPVCRRHRSVLVIAGIAASLLLVGKFATRNSYKQQRAGELILFLLMGPLLFAGFHFAMGFDLASKYSLEILCGSVLWGLFIFNLVQMNNFSQVMTSSQNGIRNSITKLGFDRSKKFLVMTWLIILLYWMVFQFYFFEIQVAVISTLVLFSFSISYFRNLKRISSPIGSGLKKIKKEAQLLFVLATFVLFAEKFFQIWKL